VLFEGVRRRPGGFGYGFFLTTVIAVCHGLLFFFFFVVGCL